MHTRFLRSFAIALAVALPLGTFAATYAKPSELLWALSQQKNRPVDFAEELHGHYEDFYASAWLTGNAQGTTPKDALGNFKLTVDVTDGKKNKARLKVAARVKDQIAYVMIEEFDAKLEDSLKDVTSSIHTKQWVKIPLDEQAETIHEELTQDQRDAVDRALNLTQKKTANGTTYTLTLKREIIREIYKALRQATNGTGAQKYVNKKTSMPKASATFTIQTDVKDLLRAVDGNFAITNRQFSLTGKGWLKVRSAPVTVTVPSNTETLDEYLQ